MLRRKKAPENFYRQVIMLVIPMALQNLINVGVTSADIIMLGKLNEMSMSAVSIANQVQYVMILLLFGIASGTTVLNAQYWGKGNIRAIEMVLGISMRIGIIVSFIFSVVAIIFPRWALGIFTDDKILINLGVDYLRIVAFSYVITAITLIYLFTVKSMEMIRISTVIYSISFVVNVGINYVMIFGKLGFPSLGVTGAAIGTLSARIIELLIVIIFSRRIKHKLRWRLKDILFNNKILRKDFIKFSLPIVFNETIWGAGMATLTAIYGHIGKDLVAANSVAQVTRQLFMVVAFGIAVAAALLVGKKIGENKLKEAENYAYHMIKLSLIVGCVGAGILFLSRTFILENIVTEATTRYYLNIMLIIMIFYVIAQSFTATLIVGIFRAGGDSKIGLIIDILSMWTGSLLFAALAAFVFKLPIWLVIIIALADEFIKMPIAYYRYKKKIWLKNITREEVE